MDLQQPPGYFVKLCSNNQSDSISTENAEPNNTENSELTYLLSLDQIDGTSRMVHLTEEGARALGIFSNNAAENGTINPSAAINTEGACINHKVKKLNKTVTRRKKVTNDGKSNVDKVQNEQLKVKAEAPQPLGSCENPIEIIKEGEIIHSRQNLSQDYLQQIADALHFSGVKAEKEEEQPADDDSANVIYRVVYPEELDLKPKQIPLRRGRPKKRRLSEEELEIFDVKPIPIVEPEPEPEFIPIKSVRTRSGRITRPPKYIKNDYQKIDTTSKVDNMETDIKIIEFEPLKTNQKPSTNDVPVKTNQLENHQRKRSIAAQFRCPKCKKAYLGHSKMLKHLQKHPDHGPIPEHCKSKHNDTWNFLIDLSNKNPAGQRGVKFCKELVTFLHNVRVLAKMFFKPSTGLDKNLYFVDGTLANVLGIESGNYVLNENELHKEVTMFAFLTNNRRSDSNIELDTNISSDASNAKAINGNFDLDAFVQKCQTDNQDVEQIPQVKNNCSDNLSFVENSHCTILNGNSDNEFNHKLGSQDINKNSKSDCTINDLDFHRNKLHFDTIQNSNHNGFDLNCDITSVKTFDSELQKFDEHLISEYDTSKRKTSQLEECNGTSQVHEQNNHPKSINPDLSLQGELLSDSSLLNSLPNLRTSVDELMLNNVDSTQVTGLLDNSTSSDEVMNVDQFVNERFKNLTESDLEPPNTSLNLDLPSLELFQFHTS